MARFRNKSDQAWIVAVGLPAAKIVEPDESFEVGDDDADAYERNPNLVRIDDTPALAPASTVDAAPAE